MIANVLSEPLRGFVWAPLSLHNVAVSHLELFPESACCPAMRVVSLSVVFFFGCTAFRSDPLPYCAAKSAYTLEFCHIAPDATPRLSSGVLSLGTTTVPPEAYTGLRVRASSIFANTVVFLWMGWATLLQKARRHHRRCSNFLIAS